MDWTHKLLIVKEHKGEDFKNLSVRRVVLPMKCQECKELVPVTVDAMKLEATTESYETNQKWVTLLSISPSPSPPSSLRFRRNKGSSGGGGGGGFRGGGGGGVDVKLQSFVERWVYVVISAVFGEKLLRTVMADNKLDLYGTYKPESWRYESIFLPPVNHTREESQMPLSRFSIGQLSEEFEHRIGTIESSLSSFGLIDPGISSNRLESIRQKLITHDNSFQTIDNSLQMIVNSLTTINKGQEDVKCSLRGELKSLSDQINHNKCHQISQELFNFLSGLEEKIGVFILNLHKNLSKSFTNEIQAVVYKLKALDQKNPTPALPPPKNAYYCLDGGQMFWI
ncbi:hypothetical protein L2E82_11144 [Cichorium intybus]|uniref:Uncharacterized protein n=1 Tax=Cichorium intybus TaxID=13427 RepID=A0ACB9GDK2_CICIN|nr:hypothetical protein L2E82_11144 [Cichorium intybus]